LSSSKTVFVLGAGASAEFDLPIGDGLKMKIAELLNYRFEEYRFTRGDSLIIKALQYHAQENRLGQYEANQQVRAALDIASAMPITISIDNYLHSHRGDEAIELVGKLAIVRSILLAEASSKLRAEWNGIERIELSRVEQTWMAALMRFIGEDCTVETLPSRLKQIAFIVFNYDRCLEHFLFHAFQVYFRITPEKADELVKSLEIYHPYGVVGRLPWASQNGSEFIAFGGEPHVPQLLRLARGIKTFTEGTDPSSEEAIAMRECFASASRLVFLGFAFHPLNMEVILGGDTDNEPLERRIYGTVYMTSSSDRDKIEDSLRDGTIDEIRLENSTSFQLFQNYSRTLRFT
jgi:hypothetical protein